MRNDLAGMLVHVGRNMQTMPVDNGWIRDFIFKMKPDFLLFDIYEVALMGVEFFSTPSIKA